MAIAAVSPKINTVRETGMEPGWGGLGAGGVGERESDIIQRKRRRDGVEGDADRSQILTTFSTILASVTREVGGGGVHRKLLKLAVGVC